MVRIDRLDGRGGAARWLGSTGSMVGIDRLDGEDRICPVFWAYRAETKRRGRRSFPGLKGNDREPPTELPRAYLLLDYFTRTNRTVGSMR